ncbi:hypothetical protein ACFLZB_00585 [Nanoarchaeota archaeon]
MDNKNNLNTEERRESGRQKKKTKEIVLEQKRKTKKLKIEKWMQKEEEPVEYVELANPAVAYVIDQEYELYAAIYADSAEEAEKGVLEIELGMEAHEAGHAAYEFERTINRIIIEEGLGGLERNSQNIPRDDSTYTPVIIISGAKRSLETLDDCLMEFRSDNYRKIDKRTDK